MMPRPHSRYAKTERTRGCYEVSCITDDWDFGDYNATFHFHMINVYPTWKFEEEEEAET